MPVAQEISSNHLIIDMIFSINPCQARGCLKSGRLQILVRETTMNIQTPPLSNAQRRRPAPARRARPRAARSTRWRSTRRARCSPTGRAGASPDRASASDPRPLRASVRAASGRARCRDETGTNGSLLGRHLLCAFRRGEGRSATAGDHRARVRFAVLRHGRRREIAGEAPPAHSRQRRTRGARALHGRLRPGADRAPSVICKRSRRHTGQESPPP